MAIIIPSNHIYNINYSQRIGTYIDKIEINANKTTPVTNYGQNVFSDEIPITNADLTTESGSEEKVSGNFICPSIVGDILEATKVACVYAKYDNFKKYTKTIAIKKSQENSFVESLILGKDKENNPNINVSFVGDITTTTIYSANDILATIHKGNNDDDYYIDFTTAGLYFTEGEQTTENDVEYTIPKSIDVSVSAEYGGFNPQKEIPREILDASVELPIPDKSNLLTVEARQDTDYYYLDLKIIPSVDIYQASYISNYGQNRTSGVPFLVHLFGTKTTYTPAKVKISISGNTISLDMQEQIISVGSGDKIFSVENNEFLQVDNAFLIEYQIIDNEALKTMYTDTLEQYKNGKETMTILCDIASYFSENNIMYVSDSLEEQETQDISVAITGVYSWAFSFYIDYTQIQNRDIEIYYTYTENGETINASATIYKGQYESDDVFIEDWRSKNVRITAVKLVTEMVFQIGDEVIPMAYGADRRDYPMSRNKDGTAKKFKVLGSRVFYDGAVWQELSLQEA